jgi:hypothetical protein
MKNAQIPKDFLPIITWYQYLYKQQLDYTLSTAWLRAFIAGNGTGKSFISHWNAVAYLLGIHPHQDVKRFKDKAFPMPPLKCRILVPDFEKVNEVSLPKLQDPQLIKFPDGEIEVGPLLPKSSLKPKSRFTKDRKRLELRNGSEFSWVTNEQGWRAMRGAEFDILLMDEESDYRVYDENVRGLRNAKGGGKILISMTPPYEEGCGPTWTKEEILEKADKNPDVAVFMACMADNPAITQEFIDRFSEGKTKEQIQVQIYGQYPAWGDLVHPDFQDTFWNPQKCHGHLLPNDTPLPGSYDVDWVMAFDWHPSKPCAAVFGYFDSDKNFIIFDELDKDLADKLGDDIDELATVFFQIEGQPHYKRKFRRWQDPSARTEYTRVKRGFNAWDAFRKAGIVTSAGKNRDPNVGVAIVNEYFRGNAKDHPRIFIYERCKYLRKYLNNHYWVRGQDGKGKPDPKWSDYPICVRYILQEVGWKHYDKRRQNKFPIRSYEISRQQNNNMQDMWKRQARFGAGFRPPPSFRRFFN